MLWFSYLIGKEPEKMGKIFNITGVCIPTRHYQQTAWANTHFNWPGSLFHDQPGKAIWQDYHIICPEPVSWWWLSGGESGFSGFGHGKICRWQYIFPDFCAVFSAADISAEPSYSGRITRLSFRIGYGSLRRKKRVFIVWFISIFNPNLPRISQANHPDYRRSGQRRRQSSISGFSRTVKKLLSGTGYPWHADLPFRNPGRSLRREEYEKKTSPGRRAQDEQPLEYCHAL